MANQKRGSKIFPRKKPCAQRYKLRGGCRDKKLRNLVKHNGFASLADALKFWRSVRKRPTT